MKKVLFVLPIAIVLAAACNSSQKPAAKPTASTSTSQAVSQLSTISAPAPTTAYTSAKDGFSINFPGTPTVSNSYLQSPAAGPILQTEYREQYSNNGQYAFYTVYVFHYPQSYQFSSDYLSSALQIFNGIVSMGFPGSAITSQQNTQLLGNPALTAQLTIPYKAKGSSTAVNTGDYVLITTNGHNAYVVSAYGMVQSNYTAFVNSLKFTK
jgi:hypothetical protein